MAEDDLRSLLIWHQENIIWHQENLHKIQLIRTLVSQAWEEFKKLNSNDKYTIIFWLGSSISDLTIIERLITDGEYWCSTFPCDPKATRPSIKNTDKIKATFSRLQELKSASAHNKIFITLCQHPLNDPKS